MVWRDDLARADPEMQIFHGPLLVLSPWFFRRAVPSRRTIAKAGVRRRRSHLFFPGSRWKGAGGSGGGGDWARGGFGKVPLPAFIREFFAFLVKALISFPLPLTFRAVST